ncbi:muconate cycloisomerase 1 [Diaporthe amygdali]|uniref:muconate cycloisomerase 1 n=1 Tax=Phomopsis amygdali TaxID=1214568 RepID=UPI0022FE9F02|nr:muconate cycloisomerase 1 [Diaporthe amygdali]KAJ0108600.1 muconate cycloisomerase 1 [Diaporthe amygdali]
MVQDGFLLLVGTFRSPEVYTLLFKPASQPDGQASLSVARTSPAVGGHSWLALSKDKTRLYTTCWTDPPSVASYRIRDDASVELLNQKPVRALSGYVAVTERHLYSAGGPSGEVFALAADGSIGALAQEVSFRRAEELDDGKRSGVAHGSFGGLRHGSHSVDLSPDGRSLYVADIGHNCIWTYSVDESAAEGRPPLALGSKHISPRTNDGPRHTWPHPSGRVLYCVQEHSSMVDAFRVADDGVSLEHMHGFAILPEGKRCEDFWADEVRLSNTAEDGVSPRFLYASTRGLQPETKGYVAAYELNDDGDINGPAVDIFETRTSGGLANAIEPAPGPISETGEEFIALTDSEQGFVVILGFDGRKFREVAMTKLERENGEVAQAATAVWL